MAKICTKCGSEIPEEALFCPNCGTKAEEAPAPAEDPILEFKENNPVPTPEPEAAPSFTPAPDVIPDPVFTTGPAPSDASEPAPEPAVQEAPAAAASAGITQRNVALCIIFSIITCGIYGLYWLYKLNNEINELAGEPNATSGGLVIVFTVITCGIYGWYWNYKMGERVDKIKKTGSGSNKILFIVLALFGLCIVNYAIMQDTINDSVGA